MTSQEASSCHGESSRQDRNRYLLIENSNYGGLFFPTQRVKAETKPDQVAVAAVRADFGYRGPVTSSIKGEVEDVHFSHRFHRDRRYRFHICDVQLPEIDLHQPGNALEKALQKRGEQFAWVPASKLSDKTIQFSPTMDHCELQSTP